MGLKDILTGVLKKDSILQLTLFRDVGSKTCDLCHVLFEDLGKHYETCKVVQNPPRGYVWAIDPTNKKNHTLIESQYVVKDKLPDNNPKTAIGSKKLPLDVCPPSAIHAMARAFANGADKYGAYNWRELNISSTTYYSACLRHLMAWFDGEDIAGDSGLHHLDHALACIGIMVDALSIGKLNDNRPTKGAAARLQQEWIEKKQESGS